jgi:uncharacterized protein YijF (DUF1287 family)
MLTASIKEENGAAQLDSAGKQEVTGLPFQQLHHCRRVITDEKLRLIGRDMVKRKKKITVFLAAVILLSLVICILYRYNYIPHREYNDADFGITAYVSEKDTDGDGTDDQTDMLESAKAYVAQKPKYKGRYYATGYPDDGYGVCTDVVAQACLGTGYDLMKLVNTDIISNPSAYDIETPDINIDFRRVQNLNVYFSRNAVSLTTDLSDINAWQAGDIVVWKNHIGIISDHRNNKGIPFVIHHARPNQASYEEDILETWGEIVGHYRIG